MEGTAILKWYLFLAAVKTVLRGVLGLFFYFLGISLFLLAGFMWAFFQVLDALGKMSESWNKSYRKYGIYRY